MRDLNRRGRLSYWDVQNVEAHVRHAMLVGLDERGARLTGAQQARLFQFLLEVCWRLSGLAGDGRELRYVWHVRGFVAPRGTLDSFAPLKAIPEFAGEEAAQRFLAELRKTTPIALGAVVRVRPRGAYDPSVGQSFSSYSFPILKARITDWYRSDEDFGDTRYEGNRAEVVSIEALAPTYQDDDAGDYLEQGGPGSRLEHVDELNPRAYQSATEAFETIDELLLTRLDWREEMHAAVGF